MQHSAIDIKHVSMDKVICDDTAWAAVQRRDKAFDGKFFTGVMTTAIYCRPSCAARHPKRENVRFFAMHEDAAAAGLRPCKRCRPHDVARDAKAVKQVLDIMNKASSTPKLDDLAGLTGYSPSHLQRIFKREVGLSPAAYARTMRAKQASESLTQCAHVIDAIYDAGYESASRFYEENRGRLGMAPSIWKDGGKGAHIYWAIVDCYLGPMLVAATDKGICRLSFNEDEHALLSRFPKATLQKGGAQFNALVEQVVTAVEHPKQNHDIALDVRGTAFQEAVWRELQAIPAGETRSYAQLAAAVGKPKAYRAAGSANGANNIAVLIPCHRVVASDGSLGGYAYGLKIKQQLLDAERSDIY